MNLISCSFNCKHQRDGYCCLSDTKASRHQGTDGCIYFDPPETDLEAKPNFLNDSELP